MVSDLAEHGWMIEAVIDMSPKEAVRQFWAVSRETEEEAISALQSAGTGILPEDKLTAKRRLTAADIKLIELPPDGIKLWMPGEALTLPR